MARRGGTGHSPTETGPGQLVPLNARMMPPHSSVFNFQRGRLYPHLNRLIYFIPAHFQGKQVNWPKPIYQITHSQNVPILFNIFKEYLFLHISKDD